MSTREELKKTAKKVLALIRNEMYLDMPYLARALGNLSDVMDLSIFTIGTDGEAVRFNPNYVFESYMSRPGKLNRCYMHMLLHNLLGHTFDLPLSAASDEENDDYIWRYNIACDVTVEYIIDSMDVDGLRIVESDYRRYCYEGLSEHIRTFTAQRLFDYFKEGVSESELIKMEKEFVVDDHSFWERFYRDNKSNEDELPDINEVPITNFPLKEVWEKTANAISLEAEKSGSRDSNELGRLTWSIKLTRSGGYDYERLLRSYLTRREVAAIDKDAFDIAYYTYGIQMYGNMPLIEELEGREENKIETLVIAIDTSASTRKAHVKRFLNHTYKLLSSNEGFFENSKILILQCDDTLQRELWLSSAGDFKRFADSFEVSGGYGTDFVPVFTRVRELIDGGTLKGMKALIYFTDGYGNYPKKATSYDSVFVFLEDEDYDDTLVPDWAKRVYVK